MTAPVRSASGSRSGPVMVASFLESVHFRKSKVSPQKMKDSDIDALIAAAQQLDSSLESSIDDFYASSDGYVTLESYLNAIKTSSKNFIAGSPMYCREVETLKRWIHKYKCAIVETYLANSFLTEVVAPGTFSIPSAGNGPIKVKDYTKAFAAVGYDTDGLLVLNSLGPSWGSLGYAKISWSVLTGNVTFPDNSDTARCFIKAAAFSHCFG